MEDAGQEFHHRIRDVEEFSSGAPNAKLQVSKPKVEATLTMTN